MSPRKGSVNSDQITTTTASLRACRTLDECIVTLIRLTAEVQGLRCDIPDRCRIYSQGKKEEAKVYHSPRLLLSLTFQWKRLQGKKEVGKERKQRTLL